jgi:hypothetical protein
MPHFIFPNQPIRYETGRAAATLTRKGWVELPEQPDPSASWDGVQWVTPEPPPPEPQWVAFGTALVPDPAVNALVAAAATNAPVLHGMLILGLGQAAQGDPQTFGAAWTAARGAGLASAELIEHMQQTAGAFNLPEEFIAGLAA